MIRVIIADDHPLVRQGLRSLLDDEADISVVGEAGDGQEALALAGRLRPEVMIVDISMPAMNGLQVAAALRARGERARLVFLSMYRDEVLVREALRLGVAGYVLKRSVTEELLQAVRAAARGETYLSPAVAEVAGELRPAPDEDGAGPGLNSLTPREGQVLQLVAQGLKNTAIAHRLKMSVKTVEKHRARLMSKLNARDRAELLRRAVRLGLVEEG